jgi:hypothetical protein
MAFNEVLLSTSKSVFSKLFTSLFLAASDSRLLSIKTSAENFLHIFSMVRSSAYQISSGSGGLEMSRNKKVLPMSFKSLNRFS